MIGSRSIEEVLASIGFKPAPASDYVTVERNKRMFAKMRRHDSYDSSMVVCPCGSPYSWEGVDDGLALFLDDHAECCGETHEKTRA